MTLTIYCPCADDIVPEDQCRRCPHPQPARGGPSQPRHRADTSSTPPPALDGRAGTYSRETASEAHEARHARR